jgi:hypothetical protein
MPRVSNSVCFVVLIISCVMLTTLADEVTSIPPTTAETADAPKANPSSTDGPAPANHDPLAEKKAAARKARDEARAQWLKVYEERAAKEAAARAEYEANLRTQPVTFGSTIVLKHAETNTFLAGTNFKYFHRHSSGQHQIIAATSEDGYAHWRVLPKVIHVHDQILWPSAQWHNRS